MEPLTAVSLNTHMAMTRVAVVGFGPTATLIVIEALVPVEVEIEVVAVAVVVAVSQGGVNRSTVVSDDEARAGTEKVATEARCIGTRPADEQERRSVPARASHGGTPAISSR